MTRPKTKILVDGGDPQETRQVKELLGFVDGQTTNPSLIAKNPHIKELIASGHKLSDKEEMDEYKKIVQTISPLVGDAGVSIEVFSDEKTTAQEMFSQAQEMFSWIPNGYIKYPCTPEGLRAAQMSGEAGHEDQYNPLLFAETGSRSLRSNERHKGASVCLAFRRALG